MLVKIIKSNANFFLKILISVRSACIKKKPSRMRTEKKKSVYMYMYIFNVYVRKMMMKQIIVI